VIDTAGPEVLLGERVRRDLETGMALLADLLRRTLGPSTGVVLSQREGQGPEAIVSAGVLARRMIAGARRPESVGMMLLRHGVWRVHEATGDGGATTAALIHSLVTRGMRLIASGSDPLALRQGMRMGLAAALPALRGQTRPLDGDGGHLPALLRTAAPDREVADALGAIFAELGPEAGVEIEEYVGRRVGHRLIQGSRWAGAPVSSGFAGPAGEDTVLEEPYLLVSDQPLTRAEEVVPLLEQVVEEAGGPLLIVAPEVTGVALATLLRYRGSGTLDIVACRPTSDGHIREQLEDVATVTGAHLIGEELGYRLDDATTDDLGYARGVRIGPGWIEVAVGAGDAAAVEARCRALRAELARTRDEVLRSALIRRIGNLGARSGVLELGASTDSERELRREQVERTLRLVPVAVEEGVLPGGAASLLQCRAALDGAGLEGDALAGMMLVREALAAPMTWLIRNAGREPAPILAEVARLGPAHGYDVVEGGVRDMWASGILDVTKVMRLALEAAVSTAATALTAEALVLTRSPVISVTP
jgi:chaperonin GroEL